MATLGFCGLGIMGRAMAARLIGAAHTVRLWSRSGVPDDLLARGGVRCASPAEAARGAEVVWTNVTDTAAVEAVLFAPGGVAQGAAARTVVVDHSTIDPGAARRFATALAEREVELLDAPVSGGEIGARDGTLAIMVGGKPEVFERAKPFLDLLGRNVTLVGPSGSGQTAKVANQIIVGLTIEAVAEALVFASKAGADPTRVRQALMGGFAGSRILEVHGERMITRSFTPGGRLAIHMKDFDIALSGARALGVSLPAVAKAQQLFAACLAIGGADWDHSAMVRALERLAAHDVGPGKGGQA